MKNDRYIITLAVLTLATAVGWIIFDAYHAYITSTITPALQKISVPLTPRIETSIFDKLKLRHVE